MESTVITPTPGAALVTVGDRHGHEGHREHGHDGWEKAALREELANFRSTTERFANLKDVVVDGIKETLKGDGLLGQYVANASKDAAVGFKDGLVTAYQVEGRASTQAEKLAAANILATTIGFKDGLIDSSKNAAAVALQNAINQAATLAAIAECCCETKELIREQNGQTRDLINANEQARLRDIIASIPRGVAVTVPVTL